VTPPGRRTTHTPWVSSAGRPSAVRDAWPAARNSASLLPCSRAGISTRAIPGAVDLADRRLISVRRSAFLCLHPHRALARPIGFGSRLGPRAAKGCWGGAREAGHRRAAQSE